MRFFTLLLIVCGLLQSGCERCGPQKELAFDLSLYSEDSLLTLNRVYAIKAVDTVFFSILGENYDRGGWSFELPLTMQEDQTTYFFEFNQRKDSLTVLYDRKFYHKDGCGYVVDIEDVSVEGSFSEVYQTFDPYVGEGQNRILDYYSGGLRIRATL